MPVDATSIAAAAKTTKEAAPLLSWLVKKYRSWRVPKARRNTYGIAVAIATENEAQRAQITSDFIDTMKKALADSGLSEIISIVDVPGERALKIRDVNGAEKLVNKSGSVLLIWGRARVRRSKGQAYHVIDFNALLRHEFIENETSLAIARDMTAFLGGRRSIAVEDDLYQFEVNAQTTHIAALYFFSLGAAVSGELELALKVLDDLAPRVARVNAQTPPDIRKTLEAIRARTKAGRGWLHFHLASVAHYRWRRSRDRRELDVVSRHLDAAEALLPGVYQVWILRALNKFVGDRDLRGARREFKKCREARIADPTWRLGDAFLMAYGGSMVSAVRAYKSAFGMEFTSQVALEVEEFIEWILSEEPDKVQLHFCLGLINLWGKRDGGTALYHFKKFLEQAEETQFPELREQARRHVEDLS